MWVYEMGFIFFFFLRSEKKLCKRISAKDFQATNHSKKKIKNTVIFINEINNRI